MTDRSVQYVAPDGQSAGIKLEEAGEKPDDESM